METLAFLHAAVIYYEEPSSISKIKVLQNFDRIASKSATAGFVATSALVGTIIHAAPTHTDLAYSDKASVAAKLQSAPAQIAVDGVSGRETSAKLKSYKAEQGGLVVDVIAESATLTSLKLSNLQNNPKNLPAQFIQGQREQYGKLFLDNDTPHRVILFLHEPNQAGFSRYAYMPPCSRRELRATYSNLWGVSADGTSKATVGYIAAKNGDFFEVKVSKLDKNKDIPSLCKEDFQTKPVRTFNLAALKALAGKAISASKNVASFTVENADDAPKMAEYLNAYSSVMDEATLGIKEIFGTLGISNPKAQKYLTQKIISNKNINKGNLESNLREWIDDLIAAGCVGLNINSLGPTNTASLINIKGHIDSIPSSDLSFPKGEVVLQVFELASQAAEEVCEKAPRSMFTVPNTSPQQLLQVKVYSDNQGC